MSSVDLRFFTGSLPKTLNQKGLIMSKEEQGTEAGRNASFPKQNNYLVGEIKIYTTEINVSNRNAK